MLLSTPGEMLYCREDNKDEAKQYHCKKYRNYTSYCGMETARFQKISATEN